VLASVRKGDRKRDVQHRLENMIWLQLIHDEHNNRPKSRPTVIERYVMLSDALTLDS